MKWTDAQQAAIDAPKPGSLASQTLLVAAGRLRENRRFGGTHHSALEI